jgi:biofilm PGA synthesis N-glycosyltransferase PgaC
LSEFAEADLPRISIVIPAYNERLNIDRCILSLKAQTYPHHLMEIVVVDDGSDDDTLNRILRHMSRTHSLEGFTASSFSVSSPKFDGVLNFVRRKRGLVAAHGKAAAVNAALDLVSGDIIVAIDSDVVLEPDAIENAARYFLSDERLIAATGHLVIDPYLVVEVGRDGNYLLDEHQMPISRKLTPSEEFLTASQFLEYATSFHLGRHTESITNTMFTMAGACAIFRREAFELCGKYRGRTVSEDADITMAIHDIPGRRIGYLPEVRVHLAPVLSWASLYSQRTRWQRGALEVSAVHKVRESEHRFHRLFWKVAFPLRLQVDHTLAMPRLVWTFLLFTMPLFGYAWLVIAQVLLLLCMFYIVINTIRVLVAYGFSSPPEKVLIRRYLLQILWMPIYNIFLFWTRMSAVLRTITEDAIWTVHNPLLENLEDGNLYRSVVRITGSFFSIFH